MELKNILQYIPTKVRVFIKAFIVHSAEVFMTFLIILIAVSILQGICIGIEDTFTVRKRYYKPEEETEAELTEEEKRIDRIKNSTKEFLPDGTIHLINRLRGRTKTGQFMWSNTKQIYDVNDNLLWEGALDQEPYEYLPRAKELRQNRGVLTRRYLKRMQIVTPTFSRYLEIPVGLDENTEQFWRYDPGEKYFIGYDNRWEKIGYLGSNGFKDSKSEVEPFGKFRLFTAWCPVDSENLILLWQTQRQIHQIDFNKRLIKLLFESVDSDIQKINLHAWRSLSQESEEYADPKKYRPMMHCETSDGKHHLILKESKRQFSLDLRYPSFVVTDKEILVRNIDNNMPLIPTIRSQELIDKWVKEVRDKTWNYWVELYKLDNQGNLELLNRYDWVRPPARNIVIQTKDSRPIVQRSVSQFSPLMYDLFLRYLGRKIYTRSYTSEQRGTFSYDLVQAIMYLSPQNNIINMILSVLMMGFVFWHGWPRRTTWAKFIFWVIFTGLFNIAGLLTYLALNHTAVVRCGACGKRRGLAQVECVRCKAQLPAPERGKLDLIYSI